MGLCTSAAEEERKMAARRAKFEDFTATLNKNKLARDKFVELDVDSNGLLEGQELLLLSMWVWEGFHEKPASLKDLQRLTQKILRKTDKDNNEALTWDEFCTFYHKAAQDMQRKQEK